MQERLRQLVAIGGFLLFKKEGRIHRYGKPDLMD